MEYHTLYDVRDDSWLFIDDAMSGVAVLGFALFWMAMWSLGYLATRRTDPAKAPKMIAGFVVGSLFIALGVYLLFDRTLPMVAEHRRCCRWLDEGPNVVIEGTVAEVKRRPKQASIYRVGEAWFGGGRRMGGFHWDFTAAGTKDARLTPGMAVRVTVREGRVLRIESPSPP